MLTKKEIVNKSRIYKSGIDFIQNDTRIMVSGWAIKDMEGKLLTIIEAMGLSEKQENAVKSYMRQALWGSLDDGYVVIVSEEDAITILDPIFPRNINIEQQ